MLRENLSVINVVEYEICIPETEVIVLLVLPDRKEYKGRLIPNSRGDASFYFDDLPVLLEEGIYAIKVLPLEDYIVNEIFFCMVDEEQEEIEITFKDTEEAIFKITEDIQHVYISIDYKKLQHSDVTFEELH